MSLDDVLPSYEFWESHQRAVGAPPEAVRRAIDEWPAGDHPLLRLLFRLRGLGRTGGTLRDLTGSLGFVCLRDTPEEVVYGDVARHRAGG
jgi:hypothetical protein